MAVAAVTAAAGTEGSASEEEEVTLVVVRVEVMRLEVGVAVLHTISSSLLSYLPPPSLSLTILLLFDAVHLPVVLLKPRLKPQTQCASYSICQLRMTRVLSVVEKSLSKMCAAPACTRAKAPRGLGTVLACSQSHLALQDFHT